MLFGESTTIHKPSYFSLRNKFQQDEEKNRSAPTLFFDRKSSPQPHNVRMLDFPHKIHILLKVTPLTQVSILEPLHSHRVSIIKHHPVHRPQAPFSSLLFTALLSLLFTALFVVLGGTGLLAAGEEEAALSSAADLEVARTTLTFNV